MELGRFCLAPEVRDPDVVRHGLGPRLAAGWFDRHAVNAWLVWVARLSAATEIRLLIVMS